MSKKIKILLLEDVAGLGSTGDIVSVWEGYARNRLFPQGQAALADAGSQQQVVGRAQQQKGKREQELAQLRGVADKLDGTELSLVARIKDGDEIFGSISAKQIVDELNKQASLQLKSKDLRLKSPLKKLGSHDVMVRLSPQVEFNIIVTVTAGPAGEQAPPS